MPDVRAALLLCCVLSRGASGQYIAVTPLPSTQDSDVGLLIKSMIRHSGGCSQLAGVYRASFGLCSPQNVKDFGNLKWKATAGSAAMFGTCEIPDSPCTVELVADRMISWSGLCAGIAVFPMQPRPFPRAASPAASLASSMAPCCLPGRSNAHICTGT